MTSWRFAAAAAFALVAAGGLIFAFTNSAFSTDPRAAGANKEAMELLVREYLLEHPEILIEMMQRLDTRQAEEQEAMREKALAELGKDTLLDPRIAYVTGPQGAKTTLIEFFDYRCTYCKRSVEGVKKLMKERKDVRFAFIEFPILTESSDFAARAALAARRQNGKYLPFHFALMEADGDLPPERVYDIAESIGLDVARLKSDMKDASIGAAIDEVHAIAEKLQLSGTPTFVIGDRVISGGMSYDMLKEKLDGASG